MKLEFREPGRIYGGRGIYTIHGVVFINDEHIVSFELVVAESTQKKRYDMEFQLNLEKHVASKYVYDFFNEVLKRKSEAMSGLTEGARRTSFKCPVGAWWGIRKEKIPEILGEIEKKMSFEWKEAVSEIVKKL